MYVFVYSNDKSSQIEFGVGAKTVETAVNGSFPLSMSSEFISYCLGERNPAIRIGHEKYKYMYVCIYIFFFFCIYFCLTLHCNEV